MICDINEEILRLKKSVPGIKCDNVEGVILSSVIVSRFDCIYYSILQKLVRPL